jgi:hypothetical protein
MTVSVVAFYTRLPEITPAEFKRYMEEDHMPKVKKCMGEHYPLSYSRKYVELVESGAGDRLGASSGATKKHADPMAPVVLVGNPSEVGWDMMAELIFRDELHLQQCYATMNSDDGQIMKDDEDNFTLPHLLKVVLMSETTEA